MCGLVGIVKTSGIDEASFQLFQSLLAVSELRGKDSTGAFWKNKQTNKIEIFKDTLPSSVFVHDENWLANKKSILGSPYIVGHCRAASYGRITYQNAHPFLVDNSVALVHNGTLASRQDDKSFYEFKVDSEWIAHKIHKEGYKTLEGISGAMALIWADKEKDGLNLYHNKERPLFLFSLEDTLIIASHDLFIATVLLAQNYKFQKKEIFELKEDTLTQVLYSKKSIEYTNEEVKTKQTSWMERSSVYFPPVPFLPPQEKTETFKKPVLERPSEGSYSHLGIKQKKAKLIFSFEGSKEISKVYGVERTTRKFPQLQTLQYAKDRFVKLTDKIKVTIQDLEILPGIKSTTGKDVLLISGMHESFPGCEFIAMTSKLDELDLLEKETISGEICEIRVCNNAEFMATGCHFHAEMSLLD